MNKQDKIYIGIGIIFIFAIIFTTFVLPQINQRQIVDYKGEYRNDSVIFKTVFHSPIDNKTENQTYLGHVEEDLDSNLVAGTRIRIIFIVHDENNNIYYTVG